MSSPQNFLEHYSIILNTLEIKILQCQKIDFMEKNDTFVRYCPSMESFYNSRQLSLDGGTRICPMCNQNTETLNHFFFVCPKYISQRERFLSKFYIWTNEIGVNLNIRTILGFHEKLENKKFARLTRTARENIFQETIDYILSTNRFKYL